MVGKPLDAETVRENKRLSFDSPAVDQKAMLANATQDVVQSEMDKIVASGQVPRGGFTSAEALAETNIVKNATGATKKAIDATRSNAWATATPKIQNLGLTQAAQVAGTKGLPWSKSYSKYPGIALAAARAVNDGQISREQLQTISAAVEIVDNAQRILQAQSNITRHEIMSKLSQPKQLAVYQAAFALQKESDALNALAMTNSGAQSPILQALGVAGGVAVEGLNWLSQQSQHYGRMWSNTWATGQDPIESWKNTEVGAFNADTVNELRTQYGETTVNVVQDVVRAQQGGEGFTYGDLLAKYENDQEALHVIDAVMLKSERGSVPGIDDILGKMNAARMDNLGGLVANQLLPSSMEGTSAVWTGISKGTNLTTLLALDPTLAIGRAYHGYQSLRYGLQRGFAAGNLTEMLSKPASVRFLDSLAADVTRYNAASDAAAAGKIAGEMRITYGKYLTDDAIESIAAHASREGSTAVSDPSRFVFTWLDDQENFSKLLAGQAARRPEDRIVPRMTVGQEVRVKARLAARDVISFDGESDSAIAAIIGADVDAADAQALRSLGLDPKTVSAKQISDAIQDPAVQTQLAEKFGIESKSWARRILSRQPSSKTVRTRFDKLFRQLELMLNGTSIAIDTAKDSRKVYALMRTTFSKSLSETVSEAWKYGNAGERRLMLNGMFDTIAQARGIDLNAVLEDGTTLRDMVLSSGSKRAEQYAATVGGLEAIPFGTPLEQYSLRLTREILPRLDRAAQSRVHAINERLRPFFDQQKELTSTIQGLSENRDAQLEIAQQLGFVDKQIQAQVDALELMIKEAKTAQGKSWGAGSALLKERKALKENPSSFAYNPAEVAGKAHAINLFQMSNEIRVPNFGTLQRYQQRKGLAGKIFGGVLYSNISTNAVDIWSAANLMAPRYVMRNAPEDWLGYLLSGGSLQSALKGRLLSTSFRELRGRKLGMLEERSRNLVDQNHMLGKWFLDHMPEDDVIAFMDAVKAGDLDVAESLAGTAFARIQSRAYGRTLTAEDEAFFRAFASTRDASRLVDSVAELRGDINSGRLGSVVDNGLGPQMRTSLKSLRRDGKSEYSNVEFGHLDTDGYVAWHTMLQNILHNDGRPGQIVFNAMAYADKYKGGVVSAGWKKYEQKLVDFFKDEDLSGEWWQKSSMLQQVGPEEFARRYFDAASNYFAHEGIVNGDIVKALTRTADSGAKFGALFLKDAGEILDKGRISVDKLREIAPGIWQRPQFVLGKTLKTIGGTDDVNMMERGFGYLGESLARISREPLYFANALDEWHAAQPQLAKLIADGLDEKAAGQIIMEQVKDRAEQLTISYIDNPNVRTQLAFNSRNLARYYRATEDFYRRVERLAKYRPEQIQKLNLVYQNANNSGLIWSDDQGTQYFIYPGTAIVNSAIASAMKVFGYEASMTNPFVFGGQTLMLTPSSDPQSILPTFASPIIAPPIKFITSFGAFQWIEPLLLGSRGTQPTNGLGDLGTEVLTSLLPSPILRLINTMNPLERDTLFANTTIAAMRFATYAGSFKQREGESNDAFKRRAKKDVTTISWGILGTRFALGFITPASPTVLSADDLSEAARQMGVRNLRLGYTQLLNKFGGDYDRAMAEWFKINPRLMPYTVSQTETQGQGYPSLTSDSGKWLVQNADFVNRHPSAAPFLTPDSGQFSFSTYALAKSLGMIQGKAIDDAWLEITTQTDYYRYQQTKDDADAAIAAEPSSSVRKQMNAQWDALQQQMYAENPFLAERVTDIKKQSSKERKKNALQDVRFALDEVYKAKTIPATDRTNRLMQMVNTYDEGVQAIAQFGGNSDYSLDMRKMNRAKLRTILQQAAGDDRGAKDFFNRILDPLIG